MKEREEEREKRERKLTCCFSLWLPLSVVASLSVVDSLPLPLSLPASPSRFPPSLPLSLPLPLPPSLPPSLRPPSLPPSLPLSLSLSLSLGLSHPRGRMCALVAVAYCRRCGLPMLVQWMIFPLTGGPPMLTRSHGHRKTMRIKSSILISQNSSSSSKARPHVRTGRGSVLQAVWAMLVQWMPPSLPSSLFFNVSLSPSLVISLTQSLTRSPLHGCTSFPTLLNFLALTWSLSPIRLSLSLVGCLSHSLSLSLADSLTHSLVLPLTRWLSLTLRVALTSDLSLPYS